MKDFVIISEEDFQKARNKIREAQKEGKTIIFSGSDEINRKVLEKEKINVLLIKLSGRKDRIKQRNSGFNQVLAKLAQKKAVIIGIDLKEFINSNKKEKSRILARLEQNIEICKKNKLNMIFINNEYSGDIYNLKSLGLVLGMPTWMTSQL